MKEENHSALKSQSQVWFLWALPKTCLLTNSSTHRYKIFHKTRTLVWKEKLELSRSVWSQFSVLHEEPHCFLISHKSCEGQWLPIFSHIMVACVQQSVSWRGFNTFCLQPIWWSRPLHTLSIWSTPKLVYGRILVSKTCF